LFTLFINSCIVLNTLVLAVDRYPSLGNELDYLLDMINIVFFGIFTMEMLIKLFGMGPKNYVRDSFNIFDALIVVLSVADVTLSFLVETA
jgi:Ion transport protein